jgi:hypothetical protein
MNDDPLFEAVRALRELSEIKSDASGSTRAKILHDVRQRQHKRARRAFFVIPLAALAVGSVAAAATGGSLPARVQQWVTEVTGFGSQPSHASKAKRVGNVPLPSVAPVSAPAPQEPTPEAIASAVSLPAASDAAPAPSASVTLPSAPNNRANVPIDDSPVTEGEFQRYRLAHDAHFIKKDPSAALTAWNEYLAQAPKGRLAVEARYNRALCLLKLGRTREAKRALLPFLSGAYGSYRTEEAQALISTIDADAGQ